MISKVIFTATAATLWISVSFGQFEKPCDDRKEKAYESTSRKCEAGSTKSKKFWSSLSEAQRETLNLLEKGDYTILDYVGCDSGDSSSLHVLCSYEQKRPNKSDITKVFSILKKSPITVLKNGIWHNYGANKDIFVFCSSDFKFAAARNYCDDAGKVEPVVEIRKHKNSYYIFGFPLSGVPK